MTDFLSYHVPANERRNAPPLQHFPEKDEPQQRLLNIARPRVKQMDPSQILKADGFVVMGPVEPEWTENEPDSMTLILAGPAGRWTRCVWVDTYNAYVRAFHKVWLPQIKALQGKRSNPPELVVYMDRSKTAKYNPADDNEPEHYWLFIVTEPGLGFPSLSKGSHTGNVRPDPYTNLDYLKRGDFVIFDGRLYRQEPEVKGKGITGILQRFD